MDDRNSIILLLSHIEATKHNFDLIGMVVKTLANCVGVQCFHEGLYLYKKWYVLSFVGCLFLWHEL